MASKITGAAQAAAHLSQHTLKHSKPLREHLLTVELSNKYCYAIVQKIDTKQEVLRVTSRDEDLKQILPGSTSDKSAAHAVGTALAIRAKEHDINFLHWQKPKGKPFHGKLAALINAIREGGIVYN
mmetsp:Transcript_39750/g.76004  ORF Transcript_39750/g.76004 Transcript_39750/m.76004 type:complete len:126 (-) Transcript_39750:259-636(-)|eukprot:CAMPEP_0114257906 /NCGR_PEP_ID=MMETSP0058-20121206/19001_1 /TAXON_ID=36894 /ORGANISM="Pyramimonas parkeae, CCMP726" /LENGTH=125 /DNA_ID=CAMNT_0001372701 /DNA_START=128 /DNA_END=505 /DNA_ORIENTATION=+